MAFIGFQQIAVAGVELTAAALAVPAGAAGAYLQADQADIRYRMDGGPAGVGIGMLLQNGLAPEAFHITDLNRIRFIWDGVNATLGVHYYASSVHLP